MQHYRIVIHWTHRKWGPQTAKLAAEGSSARRALNKSLLDFFRDKSKRKERQDAHKNFRAEVWRLPKRT